MLLGVVLLASGYVQGWFGDQKLCNPGRSVLSAVSAVPGQWQSHLGQAQPSLWLEKQRLGFPSISSKHQGWHKPVSPTLQEPGSAPSPLGAFREANPSPAAKPQILLSSRPPRMGPGGSSMSWQIVTIVSLPWP